MIASRHSSRGYTLAEMMIATAILILVVASATSGWIYVNRGERLNSIQSELDVDVRTAMEQIKRDLRLSSMDKVFFYPTGPGPYTAISFPLAKDNDGDGVIELGPGGSNILWDATVVYHIKTTTPFRLLRTVFEPRNNTLTDAQRVEQIASVVQNGNGASTYNSANATTHTVFENLFTWSIDGKGATFDAYSSALQRKNVEFGSILLGPGSHNFQFTVIGKNPASSGYRLGIDTLTVAPSAAEREAESQLPPTSQSGATAAWDYMSQGSWSANYQLLFPATSAGPSFTLAMENDRWEETNFRGTGSSCERTVVYWNDYASPKNFVLKLDGYGYAWTAEEQTQTNMYFVTDNSLTNRAYRILVRGNDMVNGSHIAFSGQTPYVLFYTYYDAPLKIKNAYIGEAASSTNPTPNAIGAMTRLRFLSNNDYEYEIGAGSYGAWAIAVSPFQIDKAKSYIISYQISTDKGNGSACIETAPGVAGSYYIDNPGAGDVNEPNWGSKPVQYDNRIVGVYGLYTLYPTNGLFTSQVFDTKNDAPSYLTMTWNADKPSGTALAVKIRTGNQPDMTDAAGWSNITAMSSAGSITPLSKRYIQYQAILNPSSGGYSTPVLKDTTIRWTGATKVVDVGGMMTTGPNYGICSLTVDNRPLLKGVKINLAIFKDIVGWTPTQMRLTSSMTAEVEPRNTGK